MCKIAELAAAGFLAAAAYKDWKTKTISGRFLLVMSAAMIGMRLFIIEESLLSTLGGALIGAGFFLVSKCTGEAVGYADSWMILLLGIFLGGKKTAAVVCLALFFAALVSIVRCVGCGWNKKQTIPFIPPLAAAYVGVIFL